MDPLPLIVWDLLFTIAPKKSGILLNSFRGLSQTGVTSKGPMANRRGCKVRYMKPRG